MILYPLSFLSIYSRGKIVDGETEAARQKEARVRRFIFTPKSLEDSSFVTDIEKATVLKCGNHSFATGGGL